MRQLLSLLTLRFLLARIGAGRIVMIKVRQRTVRGMLGRLVIASNPVDLCVLLQATEGERDMSADDTRVHCSAAKMHKLPPMAGSDCWWRCRWYVTDSNQQITPNCELSVRPMSWCGPHISRRFAGVDLEVPRVGAVQHFPRTLCPDRSSTNDWLPQQYTSGTKYSNGEHVHLSANRGVSARNTSPIPQGITQASQPAAQHPQHCGSTMRAARRSRSTISGPQSSEGSEPGPYSMRWSELTGNP